MIKTLLRPIQEGLLRRGLCPACTYPLRKAKPVTVINKKETLLECKCKRLFIYNSETRSYRRATIEESIEALNKSRKLQ